MEQEEKKTYGAVQKEKDSMKQTDYRMKQLWQPNVKHSHEDASYREKQLELDERLRLKDIESREIFDREKIAATMKTKQ